MIDSVPSSVGDSSHIVLSSETVHSSEELGSAPSLKFIHSSVVSSSSEESSSSPSLPVNESTVSEVSVSSSVEYSEFVKSQSVSSVIDFSSPSSVNSGLNTVVISSSVSHPSSSASDVPLIVSGPESNSSSVSLEGNLFSSQLMSESGHSNSVVVSDPSDPVSVMRKSPTLPEVVSDSPESSNSMSESLSADSSESPQVSNVSDSSPVVNSPSDHASVLIDVPSSVSSLSSDDAQVRFSRKSSLVVKNSVVSHSFSVDSVSPSDMSDMSFGDTSNPSSVGS